MTVTSADIPPAAETRRSGPLGLPPNTITLSLLQAPVPTALATVHRVCGGPPATSIFLSSVPTENPRNRLSGDQKGDDEPSVPDSCRHWSVSRSRIHNPDLSPVALNTSLWPSGETETYWLNCTPSGRVTSKRVARAGADGFNHSATPPAARITSNTPASAGHSHFLCEGVCTGIGTLALALDVLMPGASRSINSSVGFRSRAECHRSSGFFSRHFLTTRSSARGTAGCH